MDQGKQLFIVRKGGANWTATLWGGVFQFSWGGVVLGWVFFFCWVGGGWGGNDKIKHNKDGRAWEMDVWCLRLDTNLKELVGCVLKAYQVNKEKKPTRETKCAGGGDRKPGREKTDKMALGQQI